MGSEHLLQMARTAIKHSDHALDVVLQLIQELSPEDRDKVIHACNCQCHDEPVGEHPDSSSASASASSDGNQVAEETANAPDSTQSDSPNIATAEAGDAEAATQPESKAVWKPPGSKA